MHRCRGGGGDGRQCVGVGKEECLVEERSSWC